MTRRSRSFSHGNPAMVAAGCLLLVALVALVVVASPGPPLTAAAATPLSQAAVGAPPSPAGGKGIFEIRVYTIKPRMMDTFVKWMERAHQFQESIGMRILGHFADPTQNRYVWIRLFSDESTRQRVYTAVYDSKEWKERFSDAREAGFEKSDVYLTSPTTYSIAQYAWAQWAFKGGPPPAKRVPNPAVYEFRIYSVTPNKMDTFVRWMGERMIPWQETHGLRILGQFVPYAKVLARQPTPEEGTYIWIRIFNDEPTREQQYQIYEDKEGFAAVGPAREMGFEKAQLIIRANPTSFSRLQ